MSYGISRAAQYAIRTLVHLAQQQAAVASPVRDIAESEGIPPFFLAKLVGKLSRAGLVDAFKGPGGGIRLAQAPHKLKLSTVIEAVDGPDFLAGCFLGLRECGDVHPCPMHENWKVLRQRLQSDYDRITIAHLAAATQAAEK